MGLHIHKLVGPIYSNQLAKVNSFQVMKLSFGLGRHLRHDA